METKILPDWAALSPLSPLWKVYREKCRRSAHFFVFDSGFVTTKDEHDLVHPVKPVPDEPALRVLLDCLLVSGRLLPPADATYALHAGVADAFLQELARSAILFVEKSRQVFVSWLCCIYLLWRARTFKHQLCIVQSKREDDAASLVFTKDPAFSRISFL